MTGTPMVFLETRIETPSSSSHILPIPTAKTRNVLLPKLTKRFVESLTPKERDYFAWDSELKGFGVRVRPSGKKMFQVQYRKGGRTRRVGIGRYGTVTPEMARSKAKEILGAVAGRAKPHRVHFIGASSTNYGAFVRTMPRRVCRAVVGATNFSRLRSHSCKISDAKSRIIPGQ